MPASATVSVGLAGLISVAASVDPAQGGNPNLCCAMARSAATSHTNTTLPAAAATRRGFSSSSAAWTHRSRSMQPRKVKPSGSLIDFAASSTSWIENQRKAADDSATYQNTLLDRSNAALSNVSAASTWTTRCP